MILFDSREEKLLVLRRDWKLESMMRVLCVLCVCVSRDSERERERARDSEDCDESAGVAHGASCGLLLMERLLWKVVVSRNSGEQTMSEKVKFPFPLWTDHKKKNKILCVALQ